MRTATRGAISFPNAFAVKITVVAPHDDAASAIAAAT
jgi:hypothetical protein